jgi:hypothetical protein
MDIWSSILKNGITQHGFNFLQHDIKLSKINEGKQMQRKLQRQIRKKNPHSNLHRKNKKCTMCIQINISQKLVIQ